MNEIQQKIKIGYFADGPWSHIAFQKIILDPAIQIQFICVRFDSVDPVLKNYSDTYQIPYFKVPNINSSDFLSVIDQFKCDLLVSMSFNQIFRQHILNVTPHGIINCHAGLLPFYRGRNILNWALINDETEFGITVHYVDLGIDTGDIILQRQFPIIEESNYDTLLKISYNECANILFDAIKLIQNNQVVRKKQIEIHKTGFYCGRRQAGDELINWNSKSREIFNFIRAICHPGPRATGFVKGLKVQINKAIFIKEAPVYIGFSGQVLNKTENGFIVKTSDSFIEIQDITVEKNAVLKVGDRFTSLKGDSL
jgi:methionyl-tRNA formyltransferase